MNAEGASTPMPQYQSHKKVWSLKILSVAYLGTDTTTDENPIVEVFFEAPFAPRKFNLRGKPTPEAGWYYVQYPDGYESFSPAQAFEEGYKPLTEKTTERGPKGTDLRSFSQAEIDNWFTYHAPTQDQLLQYQEIRTAAKIFAETINRHVPGSADKTAAMRELRGVVMAANLAIACNTPAAEPGPTGLPPHQQRVLDEKIALDDKLDKLSKFFGGSIYAGLDHEEQDRLQEQHAAMETYSRILGERIAAF